MKILHVIDSGGIYGAEIVVLNLAEEQRKMKHDPVIASLGHHGVIEKPLEVEAKKRGLDVRIFRMRDGPNIIGGYNILRFARDNEFTIIHNHGYKGDILLGFIPRALRSIPVISTLHGWTSTGLISKMRLYAYLHALSLCFVDAVVFVNKSMMSSKWFKRLKEHRLYYVRNGIVRHEKSPKSPDESIIQFCSKGYTVMSCGRLSKEKGYEYLICSLAEAIKKGADANLLILGEGPERKNLENKVAELKLQDEVYLPGYRDHAQDYLSYGDVFVISSISEGLPITLLEAMQMGIPVIATSVGGVPEVLTHKENGILVNSQDVEGLCDAMVLLYKEPYIGKNMARRAQELVYREFSSEKMAQNYIDIYHEVIA